MSNLNHSSLKSWVRDLIRFNRGLGVNKKGAPAACPEKDNLLRSYPEIANQWVHELNNIAVSQVSFRSARKYWWKCGEGEDHYWYASCNQRTVGGKNQTGSGCPFCTGKRPSVTNSLQSLSPELAAQWDWNRNNAVIAQAESKRKCIFFAPTFVTAFSKQEVFWKCPVNDNHKSWKSSVSARQQGNGCPECSIQASSKTEIQYSFELKSIFNHDIDNHKVHINGAVLDCDIIIESHGLIIEYDGSYFHKGSTKRARDIKKNDFLEKAGWTVVRLREEPLEIIREHDIQVLAHRGVLEGTKKLLKKLVDISILEQRDIDPYLQRKVLKNSLEAQEYILRRQHLMATGSGGGRKGALLDKLLELETVLEWCDTYFHKSGKYPGQGCQSIPEMGEESWNNIDAALRTGGRGLPESGGLPGLLEKHRGHIHNYNKPNLEIDQILEWMITFYKNSVPHRFPSSTDGAIEGAPGEKWSNVNASLHSGGRGLGQYKGMSLAKLRKLATKRLGQVC